MNVTEKEIARRAYTGATSTEIWYLIRYLRNNDFEVTLHQPQNVLSTPTPAIIGTKVGFAGHFVALLEKQNDQLIIGDPLEGRLILTPEEFEERYTFKNFAVEIKK